MKLKRIKLSRVYIWLVSSIQKKWWPISLIALIFLIGLLSAKGLALLRRYHIRPGDLLNFIGKPVEKLNSTNDVTNFLLLGIRGEGADSPNLSDTVLVLSYDHSRNSAATLGIPRDLWVPSIKAKINTAYHYGEEASPGAGINLAQASILETTGLPIHYTAVIDFSLFKGVIDLIGGVDVENDETFTDTQFPIPGRENTFPVSSRYETIFFPEGLIHMDGETALKFVRSRYSEGEQGTDFARSKRQQLVISAIRQKVITPEFLLDQKKVGELLDLVNSKLITNMEPKLYPTMAKLALDLKGQPIKSIGISNIPDENGIAVLFNPPVREYSGQWVLIPKDNNWNALKQYIKNRLKGTQ